MQGLRRLALAGTSLGTGDVRDLAPEVGEDRRGDRAPGLLVAGSSRTPAAPWPRHAQEVERESVRRVPGVKGGLSMRSQNIASFVTNESPQLLPWTPAPRRNVFMQYAG